MTIAADILKMGNYHTTTVTNMVAESIKQITMLNNAAVLEDDSVAMNTLIKNFAIYLLDRAQHQRNQNNEILPVIPDWLRLEFEVQNNSKTLIDNIILGVGPTENMYGAQL